MSRALKTNRDHAKKSQRPMVEDEVVAAQLEALVTPAITAQENYYRRLGLRDRKLNLPLMVAALLTLLWRDVAEVNELSRILGTEGLLWSPHTGKSTSSFSKIFDLSGRVIRESFQRIVAPSETGLVLTNLPS